MRALWSESEDLRPERPEPLTGAARERPALDEGKLSYNLSDIARVLAIGSGRGNSKFRVTTTVREVDKVRHGMRRPRGGGPCDLTLMAEQDTSHFVQDIQYSIQFRVQQCFLFTVCGTYFCYSVY